MSQRESTHYCQYGPQGNVRASYAHLPFQPLWTWLTGKGQAQDADALKARMERTGESFLRVHLAITWATMIGLVLLGKAVLDGAFHPLL